MMFYCGVFLTVLSVLMLYLCIVQKGKRMLEISASGIVINEKNRLRWESIQAFNLRNIRIKNKDIPMIDVIMREGWNSSQISK